jgi:hypothetical protein
MIRRPATASLAAGLVASLLTLDTPAADAAARRPDLVVTAVSAPADVRAGATLQVSVTTKNIGRSRAAASRTRIYLSADKARGGDLAVATLRTPRLRPDRRQAAQVSLRVPARAAARRYHLIACADALNQVRESREGNNCRVAKRMVRVTAATSAGPDFPLTPDPLSVDPDPDEARSVSKTAGPTESTTIKATGADGTTYTLVVPAGALVGPEQITLTPVSSVGDLPLSGGLEAAVELKPHGLVLLKQATLTIDSPDLGPLAQQTPFYFHGDGDDFHLYPVLQPKAVDDASIVRFPIDHFSTPGVGLGTAADRANVVNHPTGRLQGQIAGQISDLIRGAREAELNGTGGLSDVAPQIEALMNSYYDGAIKPQLAAAEADPRDTGAAFTAIEDALAWLRSMQLHLYGDDDTNATPRMRDAFDRVIRVFTAVYNDAWKRCSQEHELEMLPLLLRISRQAQLLGLSWGPAAEQRFKDCARFELRLDSTVTFAGTWPLGGEQLFDVPHTGNGTWRAQATTTNGLGDNGGVTEASLPLTTAQYHSEYSFKRSDGTTCHGSTDQVGSMPGTLRTTVLPTFSPNPKEVPPGTKWTPTPVDVLIQVTPTGVIDQRRTVGCDGSDFTNELTSEWLFTVRNFHPADLGLLFGKKADRSDDLVYARTWNNSESEPNHLGSETWTETTAIEVWHKPAT